MESPLQDQNQPVPSKIKEDDDEEHEEEEDSEASSSNEDEESMKKAVQALTCRKVTLTMLMEEGLIEAGESVLTIDYLGQRFEADLLPNGKIKWHGSEEEFGTPSAWALHCKRLVNPVKRSGCGWASVRYKNKKLDIWKSIWARKQRLSSSSKSPQISPGSRLSTTPSHADQSGQVPGLASPPGSRGVTGSARLVSPVSNTQSSNLLSPTASTVTTTTIITSTAISQASSVAVSVASDDAKSTTTTTSLSSPQLPSFSTPAAVPEANNSTPEAESAHKTAQDLPSREGHTDTQTNNQTTTSQDSGKSTGTDNPQPDDFMTTTRDGALVAALTSDPATAKQNVPSSQISPHVAPVAGEDHSPNKKPKKDENSSHGLSRELPSPTPGPLPPKAILQQPLRVSQMELGLERGGGGGGGIGEQAWEGYQHHHHQSHAKRRKSVPYSSLGQRGLDVDPFTLIKCENFDSLSKIQPFTVSVSSNSLLLMDFHCHLTKSEVVGYLGGRWDCQRQHLSIEQAFPAKCRLGDKDRSSIVEEEIRRSMRQKGMMVVGWYHSHPTCPPDPSLRDLDCQMAYQLRMRGSGAIYLPCVGFILSPFEKFPPKQDSKIQAYWVMPNLEHPTSFNIPMHVTHSVVRDVSLTEDLLADLKALCEFYSGAVDKVRLREHWGEAITYLDKIKASLRSKLPQDQLDSSTFLDYVQQLLGDMK